MELKQQSIKVIDMESIQQGSMMSGQASAKNLNQINVAYSHKNAVHRKELEQHLKTSPRIQNAKESYFMKKLIQNVYRL